jgi:hypothetical protein
LGFAALITAISTPGISSAQDFGAIQKKVTAEFTLTKTTADRSDIVTAGAVLVLHKDGVVMYSSSTSAPPMNIYKDGRIQRNEIKDRMKVWGSRFKIGNSDTTDINSIPHRTFVSDEKFWLTAVETQQDGLVLTVFSDPFNDVRYYGQLKFPYPKNAAPQADDLLKTVEEVITVAPSDDDKNDKADGGDNGGKGGKKDAGDSQSASAPAAALAPIAPPPPPADQPPAPPKTISVGQTKDLVVATWGQPTKVVKLSSKEIYFYPDMKVTFVAGKVSTVD